MDYRTLLLDKEQIIHLYTQNKWTAYTDDLPSLFKGIDNSLDILGAYDNNKLVGLIRTIGDGATMVYIQDVLILPSYQRRGIGTKLLTMILEKYINVRQICLMTDNTPKTTKFYESIGFVDCLSLGTTAYLYKKT